MTLHNSLRVSVTRETADSVCGTLPCKEGIKETVRSTEYKGRFASREADLVCGTFCQVQHHQWDPCSTSLVPHCFGVACQTRLLDYIPSITCIVLQQANDLYVDWIFGMLLSVLNDIATT
jgi:hypothetical protein